MGLKDLFRYKTILFSVGIVICALLYRNELDRYLNTYYKENNTATGVFTAEKLAQFDGVKEKKLYLAVLGIVFDVTEGKTHYQQGAGYNYFVGKDGSRALVTGDFNDESKEKDHVLDLSCNELFTLLHWRHTFKHKYTEVGILSGRFYDRTGQETAYTMEFKHKINDCEIEKDNNKKEDMKYPPCNIAWSEEEGTKVWCTTSSGGVKRSWTGVPRQLFTPGIEKPRCICLNTEDMENSSGLIKEYENCSTKSTMCIVKS